MFDLWKDRSLRVLREIEWGFPDMASDVMRGEVDEFEGAHGKGLMTCVDVEEFNREFGILRVFKGE